MSKEIRKRLKFRKNVFKQGMILISLIAIII